MDISVMREFLTLSRRLNYTAAANELFISQGTLSRHIAQMEEELGERLFERSNKHVELTRSGMIAQDRLARVIREYEGLLREYAIMRQGFSGTIAVAAPYMMVDRLFQLPIARMREKRPSLRVDVKLSMNTMEMMDLVLAGYADLGVAFSYERSFRHLPPGISRRLLFRERTCVCVRRDDPLARRTSLGLGDLDGATLVMNENEDLSVLKEVTRRMASLGSSFQSVIKVNNFIELFPRLLNGGGMTFTVRSFPLPDGMVAIPLEEEIDLFTALIWREDSTSEELQEFLDLF